MSSSTTLVKNPQLCASLNVRHQISHQHKTTRKITALHPVILTFLDSKQKDTIFWTEPRPKVMVYNILIFTVKGLSGPRPTPTPGDNNVSAAESIYSQLP